MDMKTRQSVRNRLLCSLSLADYALLAPALEPVLLPMSAIIEDLGQEIETVVFLESGIASCIVMGDDRAMAESSHIGREGMTGRSVVLGASSPSTRIIMQVPGEGLSIGSDRLVAAMQDSTTLRDLLNRYVLAGDAQMAHTLLAATNFDIGQRLARWLLMYHDRIDGDELPVTHDLLAMMLSVRRAGITGEMHILEGEHAIRANRGVVTVLDRGLLITAAGGCYGAPEQEFERLIPATLIDPASRWKIAMLR